MSDAELPPLPFEVGEIVNLRWSWSGSYCPMKSVSQVMHTYIKDITDVLVRTYTQEFGFSTIYRRSADSYYVSHVGPLTILILYGGLEAFLNKERRNNVD